MTKISIIGLFVVSHATSFSKRILAVTYRSILFLYLGAILGDLENLSINRFEDN